MARNRGQPDLEADYEVETKPVMSRDASSNVKQKKRSIQRSQPRTPIKGTAEAVEISDTSDEELLTLRVPKVLHASANRSFSLKGANTLKKLLADVRAFALLV